MKHITLVLSVLALSACSTPESPSKPTQAYVRQEGTVFRVVRPIFSQMVLLSYPVDFRPVYENTDDARYIIESVPMSDKGYHWSQMITVTGAKGRATSSARPEQVLAHLADDFQRACPKTFTTRGLGPGKISGHDAFAALIGCGAVQSEGYQHSETTLVIVVKGATDFYTVQWAERGAAQPTAPVLNVAKWTGRINVLGPIKLCARGESAPYPHCFSQ